MRTDPQGFAVVLLDEEYGFRHHAWFTGMTAEQLEAYWASIQNIADHYMDPSKTLPGKFETAQTEEDLDAWNECYKSGEFYTAHLHWEDDSSLVAPNGRVIFHAGYTGNRS